MSLKLIIVIGAAVIVAGAGVIFLSPERTQDSTEVAPERAVAIDSENRLAGRGVLTNLFGNGQDLICNYTLSEEDGTRNEGTMYYDGTDERFQVRNETTGPDGVMQSGVINDGETLYTWTETTEGVFAIAVPADQSEPEIPEADAIPGFDPAEFTPETEEPTAFTTEVDYDCVPWQVDESVFTPPANIDFLTPEDMFREAFEGLEGFDPSMLPQS